MSKEWIRELWVNGGGKFVTARNDAVRAALKAGGGRPATKAERAAYEAGALGVEEAGRPRASEHVRVGPTDLLAADVRPEAVSPPAPKASSRPKTGTPRRRRVRKLREN